MTELDQLVDKPGDYPLGATIKLRGTLSARGASWAIRIGAARYSKAERRAITTAAEAGREIANNVQPGLALSTAIRQVRSFNRLSIRRPEGAPGRP